MKQIIRTVYAERDDITFIMRIEERSATSHTQTCVGWYHGEPNDKDTKLFMNDLSAEYDYPMSDI